MGAVGVSVAVGGSSAVQMVLLVLALRRRIELGGREIAGSALRTLLASSVAGAGPPRVRSQIETATAKTRKPTDAIVTRFIAAHRGRAGSYELLSE